MDSLIENRYPSRRFSYAAVAQWIEYWPPKPRVVGSIPASRASSDKATLSVAMGSLKTGPVVGRSSPHSEDLNSLECRRFGSLFFHYVNSTLILSSRGCGVWAGANKAAHARVGKG